MAFMHLTLADMKQGLDLLLNTQSQGHRSLQSTATGTIYLTLLSEKQAAIQSLPGPMTTSRPMVEELAITDVQHDAYGAALWHFVESYLRAPNTSMEQRRVLTNVRQALLPELRVLKATYADEAKAAEANAPRLPELEPGLKQFPLVNGETLYDWANGFVTAGLRLGELLRARSGVTDQDRTHANALRTSVLGVLNRMRESIADEFHRNTEQLRHIDQAVFTEFDALEAARSVVRSSDSTV